MTVATVILATLTVLCTGVGAFLTMAGMVLAFMHAGDPAWNWKPTVARGTAVSAIGLLIYGASSIAVARILL